MAAEQEEISGLKTRLEDPLMDVDEKESLYQQVEKIEKSVDEKLDQALAEGLPLAFAIIKETARRFKENEALEVTANDYDRDLAAGRDSIEIKGDKAYWKNEWMARLMAFLTLARAPKVFVRGRRCEIVLRNSKVCLFF